MLIAMSKSSDNWFVKIFLGIVVLGFIATGGLLSYSSVQSSNYVVTVGDANVTGDEFYADYSQEANNYSRRLGQTLQPEFLNLIEQTVMERLINRATLENTGIELNLAIDDKVAAKSITDNPSFQTVGGEFDKAVFDGILRQNNLNEKDYVKLIKEQQILDQLTNGLAAIEFTPEIFASVIGEFNDQERIVEFFHLTPSHVEIGNAPTGDALQTYYETVISQFDAPEYRQADILLLDTDLIAKDMIVDDEEVKNLYELSKASYNSVETRDISQIVYDTMEAAQAAYKKAQDGATFAELATDKGITDTSYKLGNFARSGLPNEKMGDAAFSLEANQVSEPIDLGLGIALLNISSITPAVVKTFEDVKESIEKSEALRLAVDKVYEMRDTVEDEIAGGATFKEISEKISITYNSLPAMSITVEGVDGNRLENDIAPVLLGGIFSTDESIDNEPLDTVNGGLQWYVVNKITPTANKALADVTDEVTALWQSQETAKALLAKAEELAAKGGEIGVLSEGIVDAVSVASAVKRSTQSVQLSPEAIEALFAVKQDEYAFVPSQQNGEDTYIMMQLKEIITPDAGDLGEENSRIAQSIAPNLAASLLESYIENNKGNYGISINQDLVNRITGVDTANQ